MYILLLKSLSEQAAVASDDPYVQILTAAGYQVGLVETLDFSYTLSQLSSCNNWRDQHSAIIFTSPRAVTSFLKAGLKGQSSDLCFVVGPSTAALAKKAGFNPLGASSGDGEALAQYIITNHNSKLSKPLFFPVGQVHREELQRILEKHGVKVNPVVAYCSHEKETLKEQLRLNLCEGNPIPDCMVYFSPSGVSLTEDILKKEVKPHRPQIKIITMGTSTQTKLQEIGLEVSAVARNPQPSGLLDAVKRVTS